MTNITIDGNYNDSNLVLSSNSATITENTPGVAGPTGPAGPTGAVGAVGAQGPPGRDANPYPNESWDVDKVVTDYYQIAFDADASAVETRYVFAMNLIDGVGQINYNGMASGVQSAVELAKLKAVGDPKAALQVTYAKRNAFLLNQGSSGHSTKIYSYPNSYYNFDPITNTLYKDKVFINKVTPNSGHTGQDLDNPTHDSYDCRWDLKNMRYSADYFDVSLVSASFPNGRFQYTLTTDLSEVNVSETPDGVTLPMPSYTYISKDQFSEDLAINELDKFAKERNYVSKPKKSRIQQMLDDKYFSQVLSEKITAICKADSSNLASLSGRPAPFNVLASNPKVMHKDHSANTLVEDEVFAVYREAESTNFYVNNAMANMNEVFTGKYIVKYSENCGGGFFFSSLYLNNNSDLSAVCQKAVDESTLLLGMPGTNLKMNPISTITGNPLNDPSFIACLACLSKLYKAEIDLGLDYINKTNTEIGAWMAKLEIDDASHNKDTRMLTSAEMLDLSSEPQYANYRWTAQSIKDWIIEFSNNVVDLDTKYTQAWNADFSGGLTEYLSLLGSIHLEKVMYLSALSDVDISDVGFGKWQGVNANGPTHFGSTYTFESTPGDISNATLYKRPSLLFFYKIMGLIARTLPAPFGYPEVGNVNLTNIMSDDSAVNKGLVSNFFFDSLSFGGESIDYKLGRFTPPSAKSWPATWAGVNPTYPYGYDTIYPWSKKFTDQFITKYSENCPGHSFLTRVLFKDPKIDPSLISLLEVSGNLARNPAVIKALKLMGDMYLAEMTYDVNWTSGNGVASKVSDKFKEVIPSDLSWNASRLESWYSDLSAALSGMNSHVHVDGQSWDLSGKLLANGKTFIIDSSYVYNNTSTHTPIDSIEFYFKWLAAIHVAKVEKAADISYSWAGFGDLWHGDLSASRTAIEMETAAPAKLADTSFNGPYNTVFTGYDQADPNSGLYFGGFVKTYPDPTQGYTGPESNYNYGVYYGVNSS